MSKIITVDGLTFRVGIHRDEDMREPWKEHDGYGVVSEWTGRDKQPSERILVQDRGSKRFYDVQESTKIALRDGWGVPNPEGKTKHQVAAEAVELDYQRLQAWCKDEWYWCYVTVQLLGKDGRKVPGYHDSLGGIESDAGDYLDEVVKDLAEEISARVGKADSICIQVR